MGTIINSLVSWRTTFLGFAAAVAIVAKWVSTGNIEADDFASLMAALGLMAAKDSAVTGIK